MDTKSRKCRRADDKSEKNEALVIKTDESNYSEAMKTIKKDAEASVWRKSWSLVR